MSKTSYHGKVPQYLKTMKQVEQKQYRELQREHYLNNPEYDESSETDHLFADKTGLARSLPSSFPQNDRVACSYQLG